MIARHVVRIGGEAVLALTALGAPVYLITWRHIGHILPQSPDPGSDAMDTYGAFRHLWQYPIAVFLKPFSSGNAVWIPWRDENWYWERWNHYHGDFGILISVAVLAIPVWWIVRRLTRERPLPGEAIQRRLGSLLLLVPFLGVLPVWFHPEGSFANFPRYTMFIIPVVLAWGVVPLICTAMTSARAGRMAVAGALLLTALWASFTCLQTATDDRYVPFDYVILLAQKPELVRHQHLEQFRAPAIADAVAGPHDVIAVQKGFGTYAYVLYGAELQRKVIYLRVTGTEPTVIPDEAQWVVVDRHWHHWFYHPLFKTAGDWGKYFDEGPNLPEDVALLKQLLRDPRFELVYLNPEESQGVFHRK